MDFAFHTDENSRSYCERIIKAMELLYDIDPVDGRELLNTYWRGMDWREGCKNSFLMYHQTEREWADRIGNPWDGTDAGSAKRKAAQEEAERRIVEFRKAGKHKWVRDDWRY